MARSPRSGEETPDREIELSRLELECRRLELDESLPKKWGPVAFGAMATIITAIISATVSVVETNAQREETKRAKIVADQQQEVDNGRAAASMYFDKLSDLRGKDELSPPELTRFTRDLELLAAVSGNRRVEDILRRSLIELGWKRRAETRVPASGGGGSAPPVQTQPPSAALQGLPDILIARPGESYGFKDFVVYPQVPESRFDRESRALAEALAQLGFQAQPAERMRKGVSPRSNQVRFYKVEHRELAEQAAKRLSATFGPFRAVRLPNSGLPNGVMEVWLGESPS